MSANRAFLPLPPPADWSLGGSAENWRRKKNKLTDLYNLRMNLRTSGSDCDLTEVLLLQCQNRVQVVGVSIKLWLEYSLPVLSLNVS